MKFEIYWDDAPAGAEIYQLSYAWLDKGGKWIDGNVLDEIKRPAPPAQKVEVGQVWVKGGCVDDIAQSVNIDYASDQVVVFSGHLTKGKQQHYSLADFLEKFEQVQP
jgi:hypothetical protein